MAKVLDLDEIVVWDGNTAACQAMRQAQIDVVAAYPITPSTPIVQNYGTFVSNGYIDGEFVLVESEHAAMSACVGAAAAGGRVATATSSQGFALMVEVLYQASTRKTAHMPDDIWIFPGSLSKTKARNPGSRI